MRRVLMTLFAALLVSGALASAEATPFHEVLAWTAETRAAKASIDVVRWLEGSWEGDLDGGRQQWTALAPVAGDMPGIGRGWGRTAPITLTP